MSNFDAEFLGWFFLCFCDDFILFVVDFDSDDVVDVFSLSVADLFDA